MTALMMIPWLWLCAICASVQHCRLSWLHSCLIPFVYNFVQSVPRTVVVYGNPYEKLLGYAYSVSSGHIWSAFPSEVFYRIFFCSRSSWQVHFSCTNFGRVCILGIPAHFRTSVSGILSCHLFFSSLLRQFVWKWLRLSERRWYTVQVSHACKRAGSTVPV